MVACVGMYNSTTFHNTIAAVMKTKPVMLSISTTFAEKIMLYSIVTDSHARAHLPTVQLLDCRIITTMYFLRT